MPNPRQSALIASLPDPTGGRGTSYWVADLYESIGGFVRSDGQAWIPLRGSAVTSRTVASMTSSGTVGITFKPLVHRPTQVITGTLALAGTIGFDMVRAWNGARFRVVRKATGAGVLTILGKALAINNWLDAEFDGSAWQITASAGLL